MITTIMFKDEKLVETNEVLHLSKGDFIMYEGQPYIITDKVYNFVTKQYIIYTEWK